jgi:TonB family protein
MELFWQPQHEVLPETSGYAYRSRLGRFLGLSAMVHAAVAIVAPWLVLAPLARPDPAVIRTVDFVVPEALPPRPDVPVARAAKSRERGSAPPAPSSGTARSARTRGDRAPAVARRGPESTPDAPAPPRRAEPASTPEPAPSAAAPDAARSETGDLPTLPEESEETRIASAMPKSVAGRARSSGPTEVRAPARDATTPSGDASPAANAVAALAPGVDGASPGPVATVAIHGEFARGGNGGGAGSGRGVRAGSGGGQGDGTALVDTRDPDFSEYFRLIERRVRSVWKFPEGLGGTTQTVKIGFALGPEGSLRDVRVLGSTSGTLNDSALSAMRQASPFPPLPVKFRVLAGQPLVMSFTVTVR